MPKYKGSHITTEGINYHPRVKYWNGSSHIYPTYNNINSDIKEQYFAFKSQLVYGKQGKAGQTINVGAGAGTWNPITYLSIPIADIKHNITVNDLPYFHSAVYVNGIITIKENSQTFYQSPSQGAAAVSSVAKTYMFEHYGVASSLKPTESQKDDPDPAVSRPYKIFNSEFVILKELNLTAAESDTGEFGPGDFVPAHDVTNWNSLYSISTIDNPIVFDYDEYAFKCKVTPNNIIQSDTAPYIRPTILVKGTYLLM